MLSLILASVLFAAPDAGAAQTQYVQVSSLNLRDRPSARALIGARLRIGTGCTPGAAADGGWVQISCGDAKGYTKAELLGAEPPKLADLLSGATDAGVPSDQRVQLAVRAVALAPDSASALDAWKSAMLVNQLELAEKADSSASDYRPLSCTNKETLSCVIHSDHDSPAPVVSRPGSDGGSTDFIAFGSAPDGDCLGLWVRTGSIRAGASDQNPRVVLDNVVPVSLELYKAVLGAPPQWAGPCDAHVLNKKTLKSLPRKWTPLDGAPGKFATHTLCGHRPGFAIQGMDGDSFVVKSQMVQDSAEQAVLLVQYDPDIKVYRFELEGGGVFDLAYPIADDPDAARLSSPQWYFGGLMLNQAKVAKFPVQNPCGP